MIRFDYACIHREAAQIRSVDEEVQRNALKKMYERFVVKICEPIMLDNLIRKAKSINQRKLSRAIFFAHKVNPFFIIIFISCYWAAGLTAYWADAPDH